MKHPAPDVSSLKEAAKRFLFRQLRLALGLGLLVVLAVNGATRMAGGNVGLLSLSRVSERARALGMYGLHRLTCRCPEDATVALRTAALRHGVSYRLALSVARTESSLRHTVVSGTGAMGLMQLMPDTARELGVTDPFSVEQNADGGVRYLKQLLRAYHGNVRRALAAYNAGPARIPRKGPMNMPPETNTYVARILSRM